MTTYVVELHLLWANCKACIQQANKVYFQDIEIITKTRVNILNTHTPQIGHVDMTSDVCFLVFEGGTRHHWPHGHRSHSILEHWINYCSHFTHGRQSHYFYPKVANLVPNHHIIKSLRNPNEVVEDEGIMVTNVISPPTIWSHTPPPYSPLFKPSSSFLSWVHLQNLLPCEHAMMLAIQHVWNYCKPTL